MRMEKRDLDSMRSSEAERLYSIAPVGLCFFDTQMRFRYINEWLARMNGLPVEEHLGKTIDEVLEDVAAGVATQLRYVLQSGEPIIEGEVEAETPAHPGERRIYMHNYYPDTDKDGMVLGVSCVVQDVTELRQAEGKLRAAKEEAEGANRAKSAFLDKMRHELGTLLNIVISYSELMQDEVRQLQPEQPSLIADLQKINTAGSHLAALIADVLELMMIGAHEMEVQAAHFAVKDLVEAVATTIKPMASQRGNALQVTCPAEIGDMKSDKNKISQVLHNLIINAVEFTDNGRIEVDVRREACDASDYITFQVRDTGIGMNPEQIEEIFDPRVNTGNSTSSGLRLAISRAFCRMLGGDINVDIAPDSGYVFTVRLPAAMSEQQE